MCKATAGWPCAMRGLFYVLERNDKSNMHPLEKFRFCPKCGSQHFDKHTDKSKLCGNCGFEYFMNPAAAVVAFITDGEGRLLVERRKQEPAKGTLDLPGGFSDMFETAEEGIRREVMEETGLSVTSARYLFSQPNIYRYGGFDVHTLDLFFECGVEDVSCLKAMDDAAECMWIGLNDIHTEQFGLRSVRQGLYQYIEMIKARP